MNRIDELRRHLRYGTVPTWGRDLLLALLTTHEQRNRPLQEANARRSETVRAAVLSACDLALPEAVRRIRGRRSWPGTVHHWLLMKYRSVGLDRPPSRAAVRAAVKAWCPPGEEREPVDSVAADAVAPAAEVGSPARSRWFMDERAAGLAETRERFKDATFDDEWWKQQAKAQETEWLTRHFPSAEERGEAVIRPQVIRRRPRK